jgi:hypothetical protein
MSRRLLRSDGLVTTVAGPQSSAKLLATTARQVLLPSKPEDQFTLSIYDHATLVYPHLGYWGQRHMRFIHQELLNPLFIARRYESRQGLAAIFRRFKTVPPCDPLPTRSIEVCEQIWEPVLPRIERWARPLNGGISVSPVPSASGLSERFAYIISSWLARRGVPVSAQNLLGRAPTGRQIKEIGSWSDRIRAAEGIFALRRRPLTRAVLLIDDVTASGSSLRACVQLLRSSGVPEIAGAVASADLTTYVARHGSIEEFHEQRQV